MGTSVLTDTLARHNGVLCVDDVSLSAIAREVGTPAFVYSAAHVRARYGALVAALAHIPHRVHYSLKANSCRALLGVLRDAGSGADVVSGGELFRAVRAGFRPPDIIFGGVGKSIREIEEAIAASVKLLNVESVAELELVDALARRLGRTARVGLRVNPEVAVESAHEYTKTGERGHKFGIPYDEIESAVHVALKLRHVRLCGIVMHVGSQLRTLDAHRQGTERLLALVDMARAAGASHLSFLDLGGGLPVTYSDEPGADLEGFGEIAREAAEHTGLEILVEPGRFLVANAGVLLTRVLYRKRSGGTEYVVVDAGMTELVRPSHYDAFHAIEAVEPRDGEMVADIVGPVCESGDFLARGRSISVVEPRDLLAVQSAGAYGFVMASHYNARPRAAEVIVDGGQFALSTARETYADLVRHERAHLDWKRSE